MSKVVIIGAGPAGLIAAGLVASKGIETVVYESMQKPCRKLAITGKGRCNLTNTASFNEFLSHFNNKGRFLKYALKKFSNSDLVTFINQLGVPTKRERGGRVFPKSDKALSIVNALIRWVKQCGVKIISNTKATDLIVKNKLCSGVILNNNTKVIAQKVVIATGGKSYPATGSTGYGYVLAEKYGHKIISPLPSLVALETKSAIPDYLFGNVIKNIRADLFFNGKKISSEFGEMFFQQQGLGGPSIITLSRKAVPLLTQGKLMIAIDFKPALSFEKLDNRLLREIKKNAKSNLSQILKTLMPSKLVDFFIDFNNLNRDKKASDLTSQDRKIIRNRLKEMKFYITKPRPWSEAIVTAGGISTTEISSTTMESKIISSLYFAGEIIDIDADTGGYNLQAAFSTGYIAGSAIADKIINRV